MSRRKAKLFETISSTPEKDQEKPKKSKDIQIMVHGLDVQKRQKKRTKNSR